MRSSILARPRPALTSGLIEEALREDLGSAGDITTNAVVPEDTLLSADVVAREEGRVAGLFMLQRVFAALDSSLELKPIVEDGTDVERGQILAKIGGPGRAILTGERTALNFLGRLSGIATLTRSFVRAIERAKASSIVLGTRKTTPGLRALEKYAVTAGGGGPHRFGLYDAVLVKDNHVAIASGVREAVDRVRASVGRLVPIQVEVDTLEQLEELLPLGVDSVLLDNMDIDTLHRAVELCRGRLLTEASGGVTLENVGAIASSGVDRVSVGALTHSAPSLNVALDVRL